MLKSDRDAAIEAFGLSLLKDEKIQAALNSHVDCIVALARLRVEVNGRTPLHEASN